MNMRLKMCHVFAAGTLALAFTVGVQAAGPGTTTTPPAGGHWNRDTKSAAEASEVAPLQQAFETLRGADHDYDGHRVKAMHDIAMACRLLGANIVPEGEKKPKPTGSTTRPGKSEPEDQATSDAQLHQAQATVEQVLGTIPAGKQPRVTECLQNAVKELGIALSIK
jgi:hypothetical protein